MPPLSPGQSCCLRCGECSGLLCPVHPAARHILPGDCRPEGRSAVPMAGLTVDRQDGLVMTNFQCQGPDLKPVACNLGLVCLVLLGRSLGRLFPRWGTIGIMTNHTSFQNNGKVNSLWHMLPPPSSTSYLALPAFKGDTPSPVHLAPALVWSIGCLHWPGVADCPEPRG